MSCPTCNRQLHPGAERDAWGRCPPCVRAGRRVACPVPREAPICERVWQKPAGPPPSLPSIPSPFPPGERGARMQLELDALGQHLPVRRPAGMKPAVFLAQLMALGLATGAPFEPPR